MKYDRNSAWNNLLGVWNIWTTVSFPAAPNIIEKKNYEETNSHQHISIYRILVLLACEKLELFWNILIDSYITNSNFGRTFIESSFKSPPESSLSIRAYIFCSQSKSGEEHDRVKATGIEGILFSVSYVIQTNIELVEYGTFFF